MWARATTRAILRSSHDMPRGRSLDVTVTKLRYYSYCYAGDELRAPRLIRHEVDDDELRWTETAARTSESWATVYWMLAHRVGQKSKLLYCDRYFKD